MATGKTNAMRRLDAEGIPYRLLEYSTQDGKLDGLSAAAKSGADPEQVFKTLVAQGGPAIYVFILPVEKELDLKKAARAAGEKKLKLLPVKDIQKKTGYVRGGCSPVGMKKLYPTFIDLTAKQMNTIIVSAGRIGAQMEVPPKALAKAVNASFCEIVNIS